MPISRSDVAEGFRWILGREPEGEASIAALMALEDVAALQATLIRSEEFRRRYAHLRPPSAAGELGLEAPRLVFLHVPKCGGTTLREILAAGVAPELICPERFNNLRDWTVEELARFRLFAGHFDHESCGALPGRNTRIVTMIREPKRRLLSLYYFLKAHRQEVVVRENFTLARLARELEPEAFFLHPAVVAHPHVRDAIVRSFATRLPQGRWEEIGAPLAEDDPLLRRPDEMVERAWRRFEDLAGFGLLEDFDRSLEILRQALGLSLAPVAPKFVLDEVMHSSHRMEPVLRRPMTAALDAALDRLTLLDRSLHRRAAALFERRLRALADAPAGGPAHGGRRPT